MKITTTATKIIFHSISNMKNVNDDPEYYNTSIECQEAMIMDNISIDVNVSDGISYNNARVSLKLTNQEAKELGEALLLITKLQ